MGSTTVYCIYILWPSNVVTVWDFVCIYSSYTWYDGQIQCCICNNMDNKYYTILYYTILSSWVKETNFRVSLTVGNFHSRLRTISFSQKTLDYWRWLIPGNVHPTTTRSFTKHHDCAFHWTTSRLTFRHHASYIQGRRTATPQSTLFVYSVNKHLIIFFRLPLTSFVYSSTKCRVFPNVTLLGS